MPPYQWYEQYEHNRANVVRVGALMGPYMGPYGFLWAHIWALMGPYGPLWAHMGPYGTSWIGLGRLRKLSVRLLDKFARFGSKTEFLMKYLNDSASFLPEKLTNHVILTKNLNI